MKTAGTLLALLLALGIGYYIFKTQFQPGPPGGAPPQQQIDTVGVRNDLLAIAQAERMYMASNGTYATLEQLQQAGSLTWSGASRRGYTYQIEVNGAQGFRVVATPADPGKEGWPTLTINETMQIQQQ
jgi:hypothetical protein